MQESEDDDNNPDPRYQRSNVMIVRNQGQKITQDDAYNAGEHSEAHGFVGFVNGRLHGRHRGYGDEKRRIKADHIGYKQTHHDGKGGFKGAHSDEGNLFFFWHIEFVSLQSRV